jgi:hypothetical protein
MLTKIATGLALFIGTGIFMLAAVLYETGIFYVEVQEKKADGHHLYIPVPVVLAHAAIACVPDKELRGVRAELTPRRDLIVAACNAIGDCPDGAFVEYRNGDQEHVTVTKRGSYLLVDVDSKDEKVKVRVPVWSVRNLVMQVAD